jgi:hypothetical protein
MPWCGGLTQYIGGGRAFARPSGEPDARWLFASAEGVKLMPLAVPDVPG